MAQETMITTTKDVQDSAGEMLIAIPEGTVMRVLSDELDFIIAETLDGKISIGLEAEDFVYNDRDPGELFRRD